MNVLFNVAARLFHLDSAFQAEEHAADARGTFDNATKDLESQDKMGNFEIQNLMSQYNQAETLASSVQKKQDDTSSAVIGKVG